MAMQQRMYITRKVDASIQVTWEGKGRHLVKVTEKFCESGRLLPGNQVPCDLFSCDIHVGEPDKHPGFLGRPRLRFGESDFVKVKVVASNQVTQEDKVTFYSISKVVGAKRVKVLNSFDLFLEYCKREMSTILPKLFSRQNILQNCKWENRKLQNVN